MVVFITPRPLDGRGMAAVQCQSLRNFSAQLQQPDRPTRRLPEPARTTGGRHSSGAAPQQRDSAAHRCDAGSGPSGRRGERAPVLARAASGNRSAAGSGSRGRAARPGATGTAACRRGQMRASMNRQGRAPSRRTARPVGTSQSGASKQRPSVRRHRPVGPGVPSGRLVPVPADRSAPPCPCHLPPGSPSAGPAAPLGPSPWRLSPSGRAPRRREGERLGRRTELAVLRGHASDRTAGCTGGAPATAAWEGAAPRRAPAALDDAAAADGVYSRLSSGASAMDS